VILQQLQKDADHLVENLPPSMYDWKPVPWVVHLDGEGRAQWPPERMSGGGKKDRGKLMLVPFRKRAGQKAPPILLADKRPFTWGLPEDGPRSAAEHARYLDLLDRCAAETGHRDVAVIARFLRSWDPERCPLPADLAPDDLTTFTVDGRCPIDARSVRAFWAHEAGGDEEAGSRGQCLVCGLDTRLVERLPVPLKGLPARRGGVELISGDLKPAESYGLREALTSSICLSCGERFGKAANALLKDPKKHLDVGPVTYLFWAPETEWDPAEFLSHPDPEQVRELLDSARKGRPPAKDDDTPFYATAVSVYVSRAVVRSWLHTTVGEARGNLARWFELQRMVDPYGAEGEPLSILRLSASLYRKEKEKDIIARVPDVLLRAALHGGPLPDGLLQQAVLRNQSEQDVTYRRAALIKAVRCSQGEEDPETMAALNPSHPSPAYHCGRLLAELEAIQQLAVPGIKATLVDRFYSGASCAPARVFGRLLNGAQAHLGKLRKEHPGAYHRRSETLEGIMDALTEFPRTLVVQDQALFSLGYYHQRAADRAARREAGEAKRARGNNAALNLEETTEDTNV
jgi:CRISPR-associated protein Csd1